MKYSNVWWQVMAVLLMWSGLVLAGMPIGSTDAAPAGECVPNWTIVDSPNVDVPRNDLKSVAALSDSDVWAVGSTPAAGALLLHWDGAEWGIIEAPADGEGALLEDVVAFAPDDVWAVGYHFNDGPRHTYTIHWNGTEWSRVPSPNQVHNYSDLSAIDGVAPDDVWAVGSTITMHTVTTLHWDGTAWSIVPSLPNDFVSTHHIGDMVAIATDDVWVVGSRSFGAQPINFAMHWDGIAWEAVELPNQSAYFSDLTGIVALAADNIYAVGAVSTDGGSTYQTQILHYDGDEWMQMESPNGSDIGYNDLADITIAPDGSLIAVGIYHVENQPANPALTLVLRYDGSTWMVLGSPNSGAYHNRPQSMDVSPEGDLWAVGRTVNLTNTVWETLTMSADCSGTGPTPTPSATVPVSTATPTATETPSTPATATPTLSPSATPSPPASATPVVTPTVPATSTMPPTETPTASPTGFPPPVDHHFYLPLIL